MTYWEVRPFLPTETQGYVPNFIAASYLITYHGEHNIIPMEAKIRYPQLDTMCLKKGIHFSTISTLLSIEEEEIGRLNPIYKTDYIPKTEPNQCITLPLGKIGELVKMEDSLYAMELENDVKNTLQSTTNNTPNPNTTTTYEYHKVKSGETLGTIAALYGSTISVIQRLNGLRLTKIYVGQRLKVQKGTTKITTDNQPTTAGKKYYKVKSGDTFGKIAQRHRLSQSQLKRLNPRINISRLSIGQKIRIK